MEERRSRVVLGLDPDPAALWPDAVERLGGVGGAPHLARAQTAQAVTEHCRAAIVAAGPACVAVKPQLACFERLGFPGWLALEATVAHARSCGLLVIADAKRGDFPGSALAYEQAVFGGIDTPFGASPGLGADAVTQNPLLGRDALAPFVDGARKAGAGVFVLVRTSNPGAADFFDAELAAGGPLWERFAALVAGAGTPGPQSALADVGAVADLGPAFAPGRAAGLVSASRSIADAHAGAGGAPAEAARAEAERLRAEAWALV